MVPRLGLEPRIYSLEGCCLIHSAIGAWWALQDSNLRPSDYESPALTTELKAPLEPLFIPYFFKSFVAFENDQHEFCVDAASYWA